MTNIFHEDTLVLTANIRLSRYLKKQYGHTLKAFPFDQWVQEISHSLTTHTILNDAQELALWEEIISHSNQPDMMCHTFQAAEIARQAWHLLTQWQIPLHTLSSNFSNDIRLFYQWASSFTSVCQNQQWLTQPDCANLLIQTLQSKQCNWLIPQYIVIAGFDDFTPQKEILIDLLKNHARVSFHEAHTDATTSASISRISAINEDDEILKMAHWAKKLLTQHLNQEPLSIACVAPHLNHIYDKIVSTFTEVFADDPMSILEKKLLPFNISVSRRLYEKPLIHTALQILSFDFHEIELTKISALLRSPFVGSAQEEMIPRATLDMLLHQSGERLISVPMIIQIAEKNALCPKLIELLKNFIQQYPHTSQRESLNTWQHTISSLLEKIEWPGDRTLDSDEYQQRERWQLLLTELTQLDLIHNKPISFFQALAQLKMLAQNTSFQPLTCNTPIQILGTLEASGMTFDYCWVMGMNDDKWPQPPSPNPFLPLALQRQHQMPHASSHRESLFAHTVMHRLRQSAKSILFSYSQQRDDITLRMSKLIEAIPEENIDLLMITPENIPSAAPLEAIPDHIAPAVLTQETIRGGASLLKDQSACPFRAFAKHRLGAKKFPTPTSGLSAQERGNLTHDILKDIWQILGDHKTLNTCSENDLNNLIKKNISSALLQKSNNLPYTLKKQFMRLEQQRLFKIIQQWLIIEKKRPPFTVVAQETARKIAFEGLPLWLRIDREDQLANGQHVIIDYKTGYAKIESWFGDRPDDPQLPLYCLTSDHTVAGLLFAQLKPGSLEFKGITMDECDIHGVKTIETQKADININSWTKFEQLQQQTLSNLMKSFQAGDARIDPKDPNVTCHYCDLRILCRI